MTLTNEDLQAISQLLDVKLDERLKPMNDHFESIDARLDAMDQRFDVIEFKLDHTSKKLNDLQLNVKVLERDIPKDIRALKDDTETLTEILRINELIPQ